jgi:hypothetical protein
MTIAPASTTGFFARGYAIGIKLATARCGNGSALKAISGSSSPIGPLLLSGVKRCLLGFHLLHQFFDPINRKLVGNRGCYPLIVLDLAVEFDTLVTHFQLRICA